MTCKPLCRLSSAFSHQNNVLLIFISILLISWLLTWAVRQYALARNVLDRPNERSSHAVPVARGGGLAVVLVFAGAAMALAFGGKLDGRMLALLAAALPVAVIGWCDDHGHVPARWRFATHLFAAGSALWLLGGFPPLLPPLALDGLGPTLELAGLGYGLGVLLLVWFLNLFNFMDGTDGIAASEAVFVSGTLAGYLYPLEHTLFSLCMSLALACLGFLLWNWPKASIFMGDVGSGFIGLLLGILMLLAAQQSPVLLYCGLILFGIFLVDASYTLLYRMSSGQVWYQAHCSHAYQRAAKRYGHLRVLLTCWAINLAWLWPLSYWVYLQPEYALWGLITAYLPLFGLAVHFKAGRADIV